MTTCKGCGQAVLAGRVQGFETRLDPYAVTLRGEAHAYVAGRTTYNLIADGTCASPRTLDDVRAPTRPPVVVEHVHNTPPREVDTVVTVAMLRAFLPPGELLTPTGPPPF